LQLNSAGFDHVIVPAMFVILFAVIGTGYLVITKADSVGSNIELKSDGSKCLDSYSSNKVQLVECNDSSTEKWTLNKNMIMSASSKCLGETKSNLEMTGCAKTSLTEMWRLENDGELMNPATKKCLTHVSGNYASSKTIALTVCSGTKDQEWIIVAPTINGTSDGGSSATTLAP
jgi:hypothetical protein